MPKYKKSFGFPGFIGATILDENKKIFGKIRIKPVSVAWKSVGQGKYFTVKLEDFIDWITHVDTNAKKTAS